MSILRIASLASVILGFHSTCDGDQFDAVRIQVRQAIESGTPQSLTLAVSVRGRIVWAEGFGWADREKGIRATPETVYLVGSLTKPMTATAIMRSKERGLIDPDRPANDYLGDCPLQARIGDAAAATVRRLMQHTAGLGTHYQTFFADEAETPPSTADVIARYGQLLWPPGERFYYSNLGFAVLGEIIERRSGQTYAQFMHNQVFAPLGMHHTSVGPNQQPPGQRAVLYGPDQTPLPDYQTAHPAAADVWTNALDLIRFARLHCGETEGSILSGSSIKEMQNSIVPMGSDAYGLGWVVARDVKGRRRIRHGGAGAGCGAELCMIPDEQLAVAVLVNGDTATPANALILPTRIADAIVNTLLTATSEPAPKPSPTTNTVSTSSPSTAVSLRGTWQGTVETYRGSRSIVVSIGEHEARARLADGQWVVLEGTTMKDDRLFGTFRGDLATEDSRRRPSQLQLEVTRRGERLCGSLASISTHPTRGGAFAHWVDLRREPAP
jgi:CubicO group peptidase (beta-lactamase class C family)